MNSKIVIPEASKLDEEIDSIEKMEKSEVFLNAPPIPEKLNDIPPRVRKHLKDKLS